MGLYDDHAAPYALAFDRDVQEDATWLLARLGHGCRSVLEPGCGPGRHLTAVARRGLEVVGLDVSPAMVALARRRLAAAGVTADVVPDDMRDSDMGRRFAGAVCPVNTSRTSHPTSGSSICTTCDGTSLRTVAIWCSSICVSG